MKLQCNEKDIFLRFSDSEKISMIISGKSRMGKTFLASHVSAKLIENGYKVHLIDLGEKWSDSDKGRLLRAGAKKNLVDNKGLKLMFRSEQELLGCPKEIISALGIRSMGACGVLKRVFMYLLEKKGGSFMLNDVIKQLEIELLETERSETEPKVNSALKEWRIKLYEYFESCGEAPNILFSIDDYSNCCDRSTIWDLADLDNRYVEMIVYLLAYQFLCQRKKSSKDGKRDKGMFLVLDECQNLNLARRSIIGTCLTEGQKYKFGLILITQFLHGNFPDAVINQFKQGGYRFYFRLTEEEAKYVSNQIAYDAETKNEIYKKLTTLPRGQCLLLGCHSIGMRQEISEAPRFVEINTNC